jgi:hypothetical protein
MGGAPSGEAPADPLPEGEQGKRRGGEVEWGVAARGDLDGDVGLGWIWMAPCFLCRPIGRGEEVRPVGCVGRPRMAMRVPRSLAAL